MGAWERMNRMRGILKSKQARQEHNALESCWSNETHLSQAILISILWQMEKQNELLSQLVKVAKQPKAKRKPTPYMEFFGKMAKQGKSAAEIAKLWWKQKQ